MVCEAWWAGEEGLGGSVVATVLLPESKVSSVVAEETALNLVGFRLAHCQ